MNNWIKDKIKKFGESLKRYARKRPSKNEQENANWINCPSCKNLYALATIILIIQLN